MAGIVKSPIGNRASIGKALEGPLDLAGATVLIIRRLIMPLTVAVVTAHASQGLAQGAFPAPLPGQVAPNNASPFPPGTGPAHCPFVGAVPRSFPVHAAARSTGSATAHT